MLYFDVNKISLYNNDILESKKNAQKLFDKVLSIKHSTYLQYNVDKSLALKFQHLTEKCEDLVDYYSKISIVLDQMTSDAVKMIKDTNQLMIEHLEATSYLISKSIDTGFDK